MFAKFSYFNNILYIFILLICYINTVYLKDIIINNDDDSIVNSVKDIENLKTIRLIFNTDIYKIPTDGQTHLNIYNANTLIFYSENGTIFDFQNSERTTFSLHLETNQVTVIFQNITFINFGNYILSNIKMFFLSLKNYSDKFTVKFDNCIFKDSVTIIQAAITCTKKTQTTPQLIFNNCKFR